MVERPTSKLSGIPYPVCPRNHDLKKIIDNSGNDLPCKKCGTEMINCEPFFWHCLECDRDSPYQICHFCIFDCQPSIRHTTTRLDTSMDDSQPSPKRGKNTLNEREESSLTKMLSMSSLNFEASTTLVSPNLKPLNLKLQDSPKPSPTQLRF